MGVVHFPPSHRVYLHRQALTPPTYKEGRLLPFPGLTFFPLAATPVQASGSSSALAKKSRQKRNKRALRFFHLPQPPYRQVEAARPFRKNASKAQQTPLLVDGTPRAAKADCLTFVSQQRR